MPKITKLSEFKKAYQESKRIKNLRVQFNDYKRRNKVTGISIELQVKNAWKTSLDDLSGGSVIYQNVTIDTIDWLDSAFKSWSVEFAENPTNN